MLQKGNYPYLSLFQYRTTPFENGGSQAQLLMNRRLRSQLPAKKTVKTEMRKFRYDQKKDDKE